MAPWGFFLLQHSLLKGYDSYRTLKGDLADGEGIKRGEVGRNAKKRGCRNWMYYGSQTVKPDSLLEKGVALVKTPRNSNEDIREGLSYIQRGGGGKEYVEK